MLMQSMFCAMAILSVQDTYVVASEPVFLPMILGDL